MRRKTAIGVMALTLVVMPAALYGFATVVMWPNSTFEQLFETADSPMMTRKGMVSMPQASLTFRQKHSSPQLWLTSSAGCQASATLWKREAGASPATIRWYSTGALHETSRSAIPLSPSATLRGAAGDVAERTRRLTLAGAGTLCSSYLKYG
jgi:hypothetical protein